MTQALLTRHMPALDGLRGLAVLIVLLSHLANAGLPVLPGLSLSGIGKSGVYLFFVLSAFLLTRLLLSLPTAAWLQPDTWADYALRRTLRIWPLYLVVLLGSAALTAMGRPSWLYPMDGSALLAHLSLQQGVSVLWSIPVEFHFYLWLPLVALGFAWAQRSPRPLLAILLLAVGLLGASQWLWPASESVPNDLRLGPYLALFFSGALAAAVSVRWGAHVRLKTAAAPIAVGAIALVLLTVPAVWALLSSQPMQADLNHRWFVFFGLVWSALVLGVVHGPAWLRWPFELRMMRALGWVSFSAYLWHMPVLAAVTGPLGLAGVSALLVFAVLTALVSWLSWRLFERPLQGVRWRRPSAPLA